MLWTITQRILTFCVFVLFFTDCLGQDSTFKKNLGPNVNGRYTDIKPLISPDGQTLFFARQGTPENIGGKDDPQDIYVSELIDGKWSAAQNIREPLNNFGPNGVSSVSPDGNTLLVINHYDKRKGIVGAGFSIAERISGGWGFPQKNEIENLKLKGTDYIDFYLSNNGQVLLMAVDRKGGMGDQDIYVSFRKFNEWSEPRSLGFQINTKKAEYSPFLASDGRTLYFASTGQGGYGQSDIFVTRRLDETWTNWSHPKNLGPRVNSPQDDGYFSISAKGDYAYFVAESRENGPNLSRDIFEIVLDADLRPDPVVLVYGTVYNAKTKLPIEAKILFEELKSGVEQGTANSDPDHGEYKIVLPYGIEYGILADAPGYLSVSESIDLTEVGEYKEVRQDLYLVPIEVGQTLTLKNIFFKQSTPDFVPTSFPELNRLARLMVNNPGLVISLEGHTDGFGFASSNMKLSEMRVEAVQAYLMEKGVEKRRMKLKAFGETKPLAPNNTEENRRLNRRVEATILEL